jgi:hypothetical protein
VNINWRTGIEFLGLLIVAGSLLFVAQQIKQDRKIALAQLNATQLEMFASRFNSGLQSDTFLSMYGKLHLVKSWDTEGLTNEEAAAAEISALVWWAYAELAFENYREGLATENAWSEMEIEIKAFSSVPATRAVYNHWYRQAPSDFTRKVDEIIQ